jgi:hypothetical protein
LGALGSAVFAAVSLSSLVLICNSSLFWQKVSTLNVTFSCFQECSTLLLWKH